MELNKYICKKCGKSFVRSSDLGYCIECATKRGLEAFEEDNKEIKYKHFKGGIYTVVSFDAVNTETNEKMCIYYDDKKRYWCRPIAMFSELVEVNGVLIPRFERL